MTPIHAVLVVAAFLTAVLSGVLGMGGGMLFLATLFCFLPHAEAIPTHAAVQLASNGTRIVAFWRAVDWATIGRFLLGAAPGGALGIVLLAWIGPAEQNEPYLKLGVGAYILVAAYWPLKTGQTESGAWWDFPLLGLVAGAAALTVGAVGPLIAPLFARRYFVKERLIATKATCQMILHVVKIPAFIWLRDFNYAELTGVTVAMIVVVIPATLLGKRILVHVSEANFRWLYRAALTVAGLKVLGWDGIYKIIS